MGLSIKVDASDVPFAGGTTLMSLVEEMRAILIVCVRPVLPLQNKIGVLVRFGLRRFDVMAGTLDGTRRR